MFVNYEIDIIIDVKFYSFIVMSYCKLVDDNNIMTYSFGYISIYLDIYFSAVGLWICLKVEYTKLMDGSREVDTRDTFSEGNKLK